MLHRVSPCCTTCVSPEPPSSRPAARANSVVGVWAFRVTGTTTGPGVVTPSWVTGSSVTNNWFSPAAHASLNTSRGTTSFLPSGLPGSDSVTRPRASSIPLISNAWLARPVGLAAVLLSPCQISSALTPTTIARPSSRYCSRSERLAPDATCDSTPNESSTVSASASVSPCAVTGLPKAANRSATTDSSANRCPVTCESTSVSDAGTQYPLLRCKNQSSLISEGSPCTSPASGSAPACGNGRSDKFACPPGSQSSVWCWSAK